MMRQMALPMMHQEGKAPLQAIFPSRPGPFPCLPTWGNGPEPPCAEGCLWCAIWGRIRKKRATCC